MIITKEAKTKIMQDFGISANDTGSSAVQVAILTHEINSLTQHCKVNPKDFSSRRGLLKKVCARRKFLAYLQRTDRAHYSDLIQRLGLRK